MGSIPQKKKRSIIERFLILDYRLELQICY